MTTGILYIVPTPIGNLEDITLRAIRVLKEVDIIACEDTRVTKKLLNRYEISTKLMSYHKHSEKQKSEQIVELLKAGQNVALVSDAGTPLISDPGSELINQTTSNGIKVIPLPGACALTTALSAVYNATSEFVFIGFLPKSHNDKDAVLTKYSTINTIFYESPNRLVKSLNDISAILGNRKVTVARELTKIYEEINTDNVENLIEHYTNKPPKGEIVVIIEGKLSDNNIEDTEILEQIEKLKKEKFSTKDISKILASLYDIKKSKVYNLALN